MAALAVTGGLIFDGYRDAQEAAKRGTTTSPGRRSASLPDEERQQPLTPVTAKTRATTDSQKMADQREGRPRNQVIARPRGLSTTPRPGIVKRHPTVNTGARLVRPVNDESTAGMVEGDERNASPEAGGDEAENEAMGRRFWDDDEVTDEEIAAEQRSFATEPATEPAAEPTVDSARLVTPVAPRFAQLPAAPAATAAPAAATPMASTAQSTQPMSNGPMSEPAAKPSSSGTGTGATGSSGGSGSGSSGSTAAPTPPPAAPRPVSKGRQTLRNAGEKAIGRAKKAIEGGVYAGGELTFIAPLREPEQLVGIADFTTGQVWEQTGVTGIGTGMRLWAGVMPEDQGFRVRYFTMANDQLKADPVFPQFAQPAFSSATHYDLHSLDLEFTQIFPIGHHRIDASFGMRMAELSLQANTIGYADVGNGVSVYGMAMAANEMRGIGFTGSVGGFIHIQELLGPKAEARLGRPGPKTPFQEWIMNWGLFYNVRGTALWSETAVSVLTDVNAVVQGNVNASAFSRNQATAVGDERQITGNFEMQFGFEYEKKLEKLPTSLVMRIGFEYQRWALGEVEASSKSQAFLNGTDPERYGGGVRASADRTDSYLDLFGIALAVGLSY
jgi:hypothetical protein